jgi:Tfp pilus assembly ATPase PilU
MAPQPGRRRASRFQRAESDGSVLRELQAGGDVHPIRRGLIFFSGPTGCGKSTTIYSILNEFDPLQHNIQTAESPIEVVMPHVNQVEISDFGRNTFLNWVRGIVREAPDILMMYAQSESASSMPIHQNSACVPPGSEIVPSMASCLE